MPENVLPATVRVSAGTTAGTALRDAGASNKGPEAIVVVRDPDGALRDLSGPRTSTSTSNRSAPTPRPAGR